MFRLLLLADTHVGFDLPRRPRVKRRRRGDDFLRNYRLALEPARRGEVDLVVHGGDLFHRRDADPGLVQLALEPLLELAERGVQVALVPGNHEGSRIPCPLLCRHALLHVFRQPGTLAFTPRGIAVALGGFPFVRQVGLNFRKTLSRSGLLQQAAQVRLLVMHQSVEGAKVGPVDFTFRPGRDVVRGADLPAGLAAVMSGHIHHHQVLTHDLRGKRLSAPVLYPGSVERTAFAERGEPKGYLLLDIAPDAAGGTLVRQRLVRLPARPMVLLELSAQDLPGEPELRRRLADLPNDAVVRLTIHGLAPDQPAPFSAMSLRALCPPTMNIELRLPPRPLSALAV